MKELKNVLVSYRDKSSGAKADLIFLVYALFYKVKDPTNSSTAFSIDGTSPDLSSDAWRTSLQQVLSKSAIDI